MPAALLDTGPVVGLLSERDQHHAATVTALKASARKGRLLCTTWEVIGEAYTLIRMRVAPARSAEPALVVLRWARESGVNTLLAAERDHARAAAILEQYRDYRLSYVAALLVALAERHRVDELITVDRQFRAVRLAHPAALTVV